MHIIPAFHPPQPRHEPSSDGTAPAFPGLVQMLTSGVAVLYFLVCGLLLVAQLCKFFCIHRRTVYEGVIRGLVKRW